MRNLVLTLCLAFSSPALAQTATQEHYDDLMKASGKWSFISTSLYVTSFLGFAGGYYAHSRAERYSILEKERPLNQHELNERSMWLDAKRASNMTGGGALMLGLIGTGLTLGYESQAHRFAVSMSVNFK